MIKRTFFKLSAGAVLAMAAMAANAVDITGAGATFPFPIYAKWASDYKAASGNAVNYQSIGSGGGVQQITAKTVDFGATDDPMPGEQLDKLGLMQFPAVIGGTVPVVNVEGVKPGQLKLSGPLVADIFLGKVKMWNDPAIQAMNPDVKLPATAIIVVHRSDGSGTTFGWTNYLSKVSPAWKESVGEGKAVKWPVGQGGKGNLLFPPLAGNANIAQVRADTLVRTVLAGGKAAATVAAPTGPGMPSFAWRLSNEQVADILTYVRNNWGNKAGAVSPETVGRIRSELRSGS